VGEWELRGALGFTIHRGRDRGGEGSGHTYLPPPPLYTGGQSHKKSECWRGEGDHEALSDLMTYITYLMKNKLFMWFLYLYTKHTHTNEKTFLGQESCVRKSKSQF